MKFLRNILDKQKPNFQKDGKFEKFHYLFEAAETFLYVPNLVTKKKGVHVKDMIDLKRMMMTVVIAMIPCLLFGIWNVGHQHFIALGSTASFFEKIIIGSKVVLPIVLVSYTAGGLVEVIFSTIRKHPINEGFLVSGMLIPLIMPPTIPLWQVALATVFAILIAKEVFGGTGMNILNPALTARAFIFFAYPTKMSGDKVWVHSADKIDGVSGETALGQLASLVDINPNDETVVSKISEFSSDGAYSLYNSFLGIIPGSVGETSVIAIMMGAAILLFTGVGSFRIMASMFIGGLSMAYVFNLVAPDTNLFMSLDPIHQLCIGSFLFGMVFMATDPVSAAQTNKGKIIYGFLCGVLSVLIRVFNPAYPEGVMVAILFMNVMAPLIDHYVVEANIKKRLKRLKVDE